MTAISNSKRIASILTENAEKVLAKIRTGQDLDEIGREWGIFPFHIKKFYGNHEAYREQFLDAMATWQAMRQEARTGKKKRANGATADIIKRNADLILQHIADGMLLGQIASLLEVSRSSISEWFKAQDDDMKARYEAAKKEGGHALAERSVIVTMQPVIDLTHAKQVEMQARQLSWIAAKRNDEYADKQKVEGDHKHTLGGGVSISINA